jgi:hypothetical protein
MSIRTRCKAPGEVIPAEPKEAIQGFAGQEKMAFVRDDTQFIGKSVSVHILVQGNNEQMPIFPPDFRMAVLSILTLLDSWFCRNCRHIPEYRSYKPGSR